MRPDLEALKALANEDTDGDQMFHLGGILVEDRFRPMATDFLNVTIQGVTSVTGAVGPMDQRDRRGVSVEPIDQSARQFVSRPIVHTNIAATPPINVITDETAVGEAVFYYRVGVEVEDD